MPIDNSIYFQQQAPDLVGSFERGINVRQLLDQKAKQKTIDDAYKAGAITNPDGSTTFDSGKTVAALVKGGAGKEAMDYQHQTLANQEAMRKQQRETAMYSADMISRIADSIKDQPSYDAGIGTLAKMGVDVSQMPKAYDPDLVKRYHGLALNIKDQHAIANEDKKTGIDQQNADAKTLEARASAANAGNPFSKTEGMVRRASQIPAASLAANGGSAPVGGKVPANLVASNGPGGAMGRPGELLDADPAELLANVPAKDREKVAAEIDAAKNAVQNGPKILKAFDNAYGRRFVDYIPGMQNVDQKNFHALLGPTFKDVEGTVRQAAMDNMFSNTTPQFGDSERSKQIKREATKDYLKYKGASSLAKNYGIDLSKHRSTNVEAALGEPGQPQKSDSPILKTHEIEWK